MRHSVTSMCKIYEEFLPEVAVLAAQTPSPSPKRSRLIPNSPAREAVFMAPGHVACLHLKGGLGTLPYAMDGTLNGNVTGTVNLPLGTSASGAPLVMDAMTIEMWVRPGAMADRAMLMCGTGANHVPVSTVPMVDVRGGRLQVTLWHETHVFEHRLESDVWTHLTFVAVPPGGSGRQPEMTRTTAPTTTATTATTAAGDGSGATVTGEGARAGDVG